MSTLKVQIFLVDTGSMYRVEANLNSPVSCLKEQILKATRIPVDKQVLLLSGGAPLFPEKKLCYYESVSDNNVYLVCRTAVHDIARPTSLSRQYSETDLQSRVEIAMNLPPAMETVQARMTLVQQICDIDKREMAEIEQMVYEQHLQQQGWASVVANFDEVYCNFQKRATKFQNELAEFLKSRDEILALLGRMPTVMTLLGKIPIVPSLEEEATKISCSQRGPMDKDPLFSKGQLTLYHWMNLQESKQRVEEVISDVTIGAEQLTHDLEKSVQKEVADAGETAAYHKSLWNIKGLEARLSGLDKLTRNASGMVDMQEQTKQGFQLNRQRLEMERDNSILPDLCATHKNQLAELYSRHRKLKDLKNKCIAAKQELSKTIQDRLPWMMQAHHLINNTSNSLWMHHSLLKRIDRRAKFLQQVERAPQVYATMLLEVVRRRLFSSEFIKWSTGVSEESRKEHKKETKRRRAFTKQIGTHFLQKLFVGFKDQIPKFASEAPKDVDVDLPNITTADIDHLSKEVPELQPVLRLDTLSPSLAGSSFQQTHGPPWGDMSVTDPFLIDPGQSMGASAPSFIAATQSTTLSLSHHLPSPFCSPSPLLLGAGERERLSLSYQGGRVEKLRKGEGGEGCCSGSAADKGDDPLFLSLQEQFPVPQCLSETLTAEVNSAAMSTISVSVMAPQSQEFISAVEYMGQQQQQLQQQQLQKQHHQPSQPQLHQEGAGGDGVLLSSGDLEPATKSSDSDVSEAKPQRRRKQQRSSVKGMLSDTSPDAETSQEFATADFYFEDSMPSSMTDSPPKTGVVVVGAQKTPGEVSVALAEKAKRVDELEGEVNVLQNRLAGSQEKLACLGSTMTSEVSSLRESLGSLRQSVQQGANLCREQLERDYELLNRAVKTVREAMDREREEAVRREREGSKQTADELENKYKEKCQAMKDLEQSMVQVSQCITQLNRELQQQREASQHEVITLKEQHEEEVQELKRQTLLEVELETDRVRTEMQGVLDSHEAQLLQLQAQLQETKQQLQQCVAEKESVSATLRQHFEEERQQLQATLEAERTQAVEQAQLAAEKEMITLLKKESELSQQSLKEKMEEHTKAQELRLVEQEKELMAKHQAELDSLCQEWVGKLTAQEVDLTTEFELKMEKLRASLVTPAPEVREVALQSDPAALSEQGMQCEGVALGEQGTQSYGCSSGEGTDFAVQSGYYSVSEDHTMQTHPHLVMMTEDKAVQCDDLQKPPSVCDQETQSEEPSLANQATQIDASLLSTCEQAVQSDASTVRELAIQSETTFSEQSVQSESCCMIDQSIQSEWSVSSGGQQNVEGQDTVVSRDWHEHMVVQMVAHTRDQLIQQYEQMLVWEKEKAEQKVSELEKQHRQDKEEAMRDCRSAVLAERQISFNEAINRAVRGKDWEIDRLNAKLEELTSRIGGGGGGAEGEESGDIRKQLADIKEKESHFQHEKRQLECEVQMLQQQLQQYSEQLHIMTASAAPVAITADPNAMTCSTADGAVVRSAYSVAEDQAKDQKIMELEKKLMESSSMTNSIRRDVRDKVSILTCNVGDLVLLCLDERHDQYVVFTVGTTLHFLHSDCIDLLGLRPGEGESRKNWVLAEVTEREYCQARKAQNRFRVPVNTKFYRVKAKPWVPRTSSGN